VSIASSGSVPSTSGPLRCVRITPASTPRPALFLDRDGVLNRRIEDGYVTSVHDLEIIDLALDAASAAQRLGAALVVVTNQGCIGRRRATESDIVGVHCELIAKLEERNISLDAIYTCPHHPLAIDRALRDCLCRKPKPGMILAAGADLNLDLSRSILIGDQPTDVTAAIAAGIAADRALLVGRRTDLNPVAVVDRFWGV
jgi:D-glycero-D-manno-heptose 1,7-bisphosphate phosphatase